MFVADTAEEMTKRPVVTFIIPAYNVQDYLTEAVESVLRQSVTGWNMIIVDDGSTDRTLEIAREFSSKDERISVLVMESPSGSAYQPRKKAIEASLTEMVAPLDADDFIDPDYLDRLLSQKEKLKVQAIYPTMVTIGKESEPHMDPSFCGVKFKGKECVAYTLDGWRTNFNGGIIDKDLYLQTYRHYDSSVSYSCADELLTRQMLMLMESVAFSTVKYHYRANPDSITRRKSAKLFDYMINNRKLLEMMSQAFGKDTEEYILAARQNFHGVVDAIRMLRVGGYDVGARSYADDQLQQCYALIDWKLIWRYDSTPYWFAMRGGLKSAGLMMRILDALRSCKFARIIFRQTRNKFHKAKSLCRQLGEIRCISGGKFKAGSVNDIYFKQNYNGAELQPLRKGIVCICDGTIYHGGLTDRLRGILSTYYEANKRRIPFYISWTSPFKLEDYLVPATFDWRIGIEDLSHSAQQAAPIIIDDLPEVQSSLRLKAALKMNRPQLHVYSNSDRSRGRYARLWRELFRPSIALQREVDKNLAQLGNDYQAFTFRFLQLLGDFKDWQQITLNDEEALELMQKVTAEFKHLAASISPDSKILITSDSSRFLEYIKRADRRIYIVPGDVKNIDLLKEEVHKEAWMKTFVDQQLLMHASKVTLMRTGRMYRSGFPRFAAEVGCVEFVDHCF